MMKRKILTILIPVLFTIVFFIGVSCFHHVDLSSTQSGVITETLLISPTVEKHENNNGATKTPVLTLMSQINVTETKTPIPPINKDTIRGALLVNDNCVFPCVLGLEPGKSLNTVSGSKWFSNRPGSENGFTYSVENFEDYKGISIKIYDENTMERLFLAFEEVKDNDSEPYIDNIVFGLNKIDVRDESMGEWFYDDESFFDTIGYFNSSNILNIYGKPSQIVVRIEEYKIPSNDNFAGITTVGYFYEENNFYIEYFFPLENNKNTLNLCPDFGFVYLLSWSTEEKSMNDFFTNSHIGNYLDTNSYEVITEALDLSVDQYFSLFADDEFKQCLDVDIKGDD